MFPLYLRLSNKGWGCVPCKYCVCSVCIRPYIICSKYYCSMHVWYWLRLSIRLDLCLSFFPFFFFFFPAACFDFSTVNSAPMHCSRVSQILLFSNFFIKNEFHGTIHTFKIYFTTVFSVFSFSKISSIQTDPKSRTKGHHKQKIWVKNLTLWHTLMHTQII